jgi:hypothetical protein
LRLPVPPPSRMNLININKLALEVLGAGRPGK